MIRSRDIAAVVISILLIRTTWNNNNTNTISNDSILSTSIELAFYNEYQSTPPKQQQKNNNNNNNNAAAEAVAVARPIPFDVDGDGTIEALVIPTTTTTTIENGKDVWSLKILDLRPLHPNKKKKSNQEKIMFPFEPKTLFTTPTTTTADSIIPIRLTSGQLPIQPMTPSTTETTTNNNNNNNQDKTRHYFCGTDWHHASECHRIDIQSCPSGSSNDCPDGQQCFADTPCDSLQMEEDKKKNLGVGTPGGTIPCVVSVWDDGHVILYVLTGTDGSSSSSSSNKLDLKMLWKVNPFMDDDELDDDVVNGKFEELDVRMEGDAPIGGGYGAVLIGARYGSMVAYHALDAHSGDIIWSHDSIHRSAADDKSKKNKNKNKKDDAAKEEEEEEEETMTRSSSARRRSKLLLPPPTIITNEEEEDNFVDDYDMIQSENCMKKFHRWILDPHSGMLPHDTRNKNGRISVAHFDRKRRVGADTVASSARTHRRYRRRRKVTSSSSSGGGGGKKRRKRRQISKRSSSSRNKNHPTFGKPNVLIFHKRDGFAVLSLKNGHPVCHLTLPHQGEDDGGGIYADVNRDGTIDLVQIVPHSSGFDEELEVQEEEEEELNNNKMSQCHVSMTSGLPPIEEVFHSPLCSLITSKQHQHHNQQHHNQQHHEYYEYSDVPPMLIERPTIIVGTADYGSDLIFATNNGLISRFDSKGGLIWKTISSNRLPFWTNNKRQVALLSRIRYRHHNNQGISPKKSTRPIILSGIDSFTILSPRNGRILSNIQFPSSSICHPVLVDMNGDGTDDVLVVSKDAIWGYVLEVNVVGGVGGAGGTLGSLKRVGLVLLFGLVLMGGLWNKFGEKKRKKKKKTMMGDDDDDGFFGRRSTDR